MQICTYQLELLCGSLRNYVKHGGSTWLPSSFFWAVENRRERVWRDASLAERLPEVLASGLPDTFWYSLYCPTGLCERERAMVGHVQRTYKLLEG